jgi:acyl carrier protein
MPDISPTETIQQLRELPVSERREALESVVVREFKNTLLMTDEEELPLTAGFFEFGFTSLRIMEAKQRLEELLGCGISANVLFNRPTIEQLMTHLTDDVLTELFDGPAAAEPAALPSGALKERWDDVLKNLYQT